MSFVSPSFSHIFLKRRSICSAVSLPRDLTLIMNAFLSRTEVTTATWLIQLTSYRRDKNSQVTTPSATSRGPVQRNGKVYRNGLILQVGGSRQSAFDKRCSSMN